MQVEVGAASWRPKHGGAELGDCGRELVAGVAFVADDRLAATQRLRQQLKRCFSLGTIGADQPLDRLRQPGSPLMQRIGPHLAPIRQRIESVSRSLKPVGERALEV
jgi:hypothetical protein